MNISIIRSEHGTDSTIGAMFIDNIFKFDTLENTHKIISAGIYDAELYMSPKRGYNVILLKDVKDRTFIEIHIANFYYELEGCIAIGMGHNDIQVFDSKIAFEKLMTMIQTPIRVEIIEHDTISKLI